MRAVLEFELKYVEIVTNTETGNVDELLFDGTDYADKTAIELAMAMIGEQHFQCRLMLWQDDHYRMRGRDE